MNFDNLISRADDELLQDLLGNKVLRLAGTLDPQLLSPRKLREVLISLHPPVYLFVEKVTRDKLLELLRPNEAAMLTQALGVTGDDPWHELRRLTFQNQDKLRILLAFFELTLPEPESEELPPANRNVQASYALFKHQRDAVERVACELSKEPYRCLLHMPTGSGKTRTAMNAIVDHLRHSRQSVVVWLAHSEELCEQAASEFEKAWSQLGNRDITVFRFWGGYEIDPASIRDGVIFAGLPKIYSRAKKSLKFISTLGGRTSLVVMDEAHQAIAPSYRLILDALVLPFPKTALLGLSATPGRSWSDITADEELAEFFARRKVMLSVENYSNPVDFLVDEGYLAKANFRSLFYKGGLSLTDNDLRHIQEELELPKNVLEKLADDEKRNLRILLEVETLAKQHSRIIVFALSVEHSDQLAAVLQTRDLKAYSITGKTPSSERRRLLDEYKSPSNECIVLFNFGVLTTGFDAPRTSAAVIARPTQSLVLYSQMVGRAIRGPKAGGNKTAEIVTVIDEGLPGFRDIAEAFHNWEDVWRV